MSNEPVRAGFPQEAQLRRAFAKSDVKVRIEATGGCKNRGEIWRFWSAGVPASWCSRSCPGSCRTSTP